MKLLKILKLLSLLLLATAFLGGCKKGGEPEKQPAVEIIGESEQTLWADVTESVVTFVAAQTWTTSITETTITKATAAPEWLNVNPPSGDAGNASFTVGLQPNATGTDRAAVITITSGNESKDVTVTQKSITQDGKPFEKQYDVYVSGLRDANYNLQYWKNGELKTLNGAPFRDNYNYSVGIAVSGDDVYVAGNYVSLDAVGGWHARYWKNGAEVILPWNMKNSAANDIFVTGGDVYIAGREYDDIYRAHPTYWKNNVVYKVSYLSQGGANVGGIAVYGNDVYAIGNTINSTTDHNLYWKNGVLSQHIGSNGNSKFNAIAVSGNDVYIAGCNEKDNGTRDIILWKNGVQNTLSTGHFGHVYSVFVDGSDVYVNGYIEVVNGSEKTRNLVYWKNGQMRVAEENVEGLKSNGDIAVVDGNIYMVYVFYDESDYNYKVVLWKNGVKTVLGLAGTIVGSESDPRIVVVPHSPTRKQ